MSDVQIVTEIDILASGFAQLNCGLSIYHWHMIVHLAWFSSVTHLTSLTFLRRYFHDNAGIRTLRLFYMLLLVLALAVAFIPTGGPCGMEYITYEHLSFERKQRISPGIDSDTLRFPGSPAMCCYTKMSNTGRFIAVYPSGFVSMMISEVLLFSSSLTRAVKLFRKSTEFSKALLGHKPAQMCKRSARKLGDRSSNSNSKLARGIYFAGQFTIVCFLAFARAIYDTVDSILFEVCYHNAVFVLFVNKLYRFIGYSSI